MLGIGSGLFALRLGRIGRGLGSFQNIDCPDTKFMNFSRIIKHSE